jgi:hypothetical protein
MRPPKVSPDILGCSIVLEVSGPFTLPYVTQYCFRAGNRASGREVLFCNIGQPFGENGPKPAPEAWPGDRKHYMIHMDNLEYCHLVSYVFLVGSQESVSPSSPQVNAWFGTSSTLLYVTQWCFRAGNRPSGPDFGRTATGKAPKSVLRPAEGRPEGRFRCLPGSSSAKIRPGRRIYGPEAVLRNMWPGSDGN